MGQKQAPKWAAERLVQQYYSKDIQQHKTVDCLQVCDVIRAIASKKYRPDASSPLNKALSAEIERLDKERIMAKAAAAKLEPQSPEKAPDRRRRLATMRRLLAETN